MSRGKFSTTSSSLFNTNNSEQLPDWMSEIDIKLKEKETIDLNINPKGAFAEKQSVYREELIGAPRYLEASFNDTKSITDAKIELAKFLSGKYYKVEAKTTNGLVDLSVKLDGVPASFNFSYTASAGKLNSRPTFGVEAYNEYTEYPFSKAGFEECLSDIKANRIKTGSTKVEAVNKAYIINREEIIRRFNGHLRPATEKIDEFLKEGTLIGVGSNSYASFYDMDYLFPQMEKEAGAPRLPEFEYVENREHVAAQEHKSAKLLSIDASKMLSQFFTDYVIENTARDNNELLVKADVLSSKGVRYTADFCFGIENEKLASLKIVECNDNRMTIEQFLNHLQLNSNVLQNYLAQNPHTAKRIYRGIVLTEKEINNRLAKIIRKQTIASIINNWIERDLIVPVNSTTFTTTNTFEELLASVNTKLLSEEEVAQIKTYEKKFGAGLELERQNVKDTGVREYDEMEASSELRLANLQHHVTRYFKNFNIDNFNGTSAEMVFLNDKTRTKNKIAITASFNGNLVDDVIANINGSSVPLNKVTTLFEKSPLLAAYLQDKNYNFTGQKIAITHKEIMRKLSSLVEISEANKIFSDWVANGLIRNAGGETFTSNHSFEDLLNNTFATLMSEEDRRQIAIAKSYFGEGLNVSREDVKDTGVREAEEYVTDDTLLNSVNAFLSKHFSNFQTEGFKAEGEVINYSVKLFDEQSGLSTVVNMNFGFDGRKVASCHINLNGEKITLDNVKKVFAMNTTLNKYLEMNPGKRVEAPMIMTVENLTRKLASIACASIEEIESAIAKWDANGKIQKIASNVFASKYTFEQLLSMSNIKPLNDEEFKERFAKAQRNKNIKVATGSYIQDSGTRQPIETWTPERMLLHVKAELGKVSNDFDILDAELTENEFQVIARVVNPKSGIRQRIKVSFNNDNGKLEKLSIDDSLMNQMQVKDEAVQTYIQHNAVNSKRYKNVISTSQLKNKLSTVANVDDINVLIDSMVTNQILTPIDSNTFASDYSMTEIVSHLSRYEKTDLEAGKEQVQLAQRNDDTVQISDHRIYDNDTRAIEAQEKQLSPSMINLKNKIASTIEKAYNSKLITANKSNQLNELLNVAKTEKDLETAWKELKRYIG